MKLGREKTSEAENPAAPRVQQDREEVAAVCYRLRDSRVELLLVRTRKGRWTFPKGGAIPGLTYSQAAALEAFEEAGVYGRIEHSPFAQYLRTKQAGRNGKSENSRVRAFLCEVIRSDEPQEPNRHPTWFLVAEAEQRMRERRSPVNGEELVRVVRRAVARLDRLQAERDHRTDELQKAPFEASEIPGMNAQAKWNDFRRVRQVNIGILQIQRDVAAASQTRLRLLPSRPDRVKSEDQ